MKKTLLLLLGLMATRACAAPVAPAGGLSTITAPRLPLTIVARASFAADAKDDVPLVTIGILPEADALYAPSDAVAFSVASDFQMEGQAPPLPPDIAEETDKRAFSPNAQLIASLANGTTKLQDPNNGHATYLLLASPILNDAPDEQWTPVALTSTAGKKVITLYLQSWMRNPQAPARRLEIWQPRRTFFLLSLGKLSAGDHQLRVQYDQMMRSLNNGSSYAWNGRQSASTHFSVNTDCTDCNAHRFPAPVVTLRVGNLKDEATPQAPDAQVLETILWQQPKFLARELALPENLRELSRGSTIEVGTFDVNEWLTKLHDPKLDDRPRLRSPKAGELLYASVVGPMLNSGEWMSLRQVTWNAEQNRATLHIDVWRDGGPRKKSALIFPLLLVPLQPPARDRKDFEVAVEWTLLRSPADGQFYEDDKTNDLAWLKDVEPTQLKFVPEEIEPIID